MDGGEERIYARAAAIRRPKQIARRIEGNIPAREVKTPLQIAIQNAPDPFTRELLVLYPQYLSFAISLTKKRDTAEDLVNLCIAKALNSAHTFEHGTNMRAWMFTIISNQFKSDYRKEQVRVRHLDKEKGGRAHV
jgi:DNA-directed RNA polymerase specialized sigma24 family protein